MTPSQSFSAEDVAAMLAAEREKVAAALDDACRPSAIRLMAGEMTAQEMRTAQAVASGLRAKTLKALEAPASGILARRAATNGRGL
jgi:hypothetical protein